MPTGLIRRGARYSTLLLSLASFAFAVASYRVARLVPSDATAVFLRKPG